MCMKAFWNQTKAYLLSFFRYTQNEIWYENKYYASLCHLFGWYSRLAERTSVRTIKQHALVLNNTDNDDYANDML